MIVLILLYYFYTDFPLEKPEDEYIVNKDLMDR